MIFENTRYGNPIYVALAAHQLPTRFDNDGNRIITAAEINHLIRLSIWFKTVDRNADKKITVEEIENPPVAGLLIVR